MILFYLSSFKKINSTSSPKKSCTLPTGSHGGLGEEEKNHIRSQKRKRSYHEKRSIHPYRTKNNTLTKKIEEMDNK